MKYIKIFATSALAFALLFGFYVLSSNGLGSKPFYLQFRRFIPMSILFVLTIRYLLTKAKPSFFSSFAIVAAAWIVTYPVLYKLSYGATVPFFGHHFDIVFAIYSFIAMTLLTACALSCHMGKWFIPLLSLVQTVLLLFPLMECAYYLTYGNSITEAAILSVYQTNLAEAREFILQTIGISGVVTAIISVIALYAAILTLNSKTLQLHGTVYTTKKAGALASVVGIAALCYSFGNALPQSGLFQLNTDVRNYFIAISKFNEEHKETLSDIQITKPDKTLSKPSTVIVVIGESASRNFMSAFSNTPRDTTPWLCAQKDNLDFILFKNAYSSRANTVLSLERALTEKNQYNDMTFSKSATIIDIAKKAGYHTFWFSNQGTTDVADTPITIVGRTADTAKWTNEELGKEQYDGGLLDYLKTVNPQQNNFIVLHFMGSHDNYQNRYPEQFAKWGNPKKNEPTLNYDNSLYYTDYVLSEVYAYAKEHLNLQSMLYFSDHGAVPSELRNADSAEFAWLRVPMFVYLSPEYQSLYPDVTNALRSHKDFYVTNDLVYDLVCGMLNIESNHYDKTQSIASNTYKHTRETLKTNLGKTPLTADKTDE